MTPCCEHPTNWPHHAEGIGCLHDGCSCTYRLPPHFPSPLPPHTPVETIRPLSRYL